VTIGVVDDVRLEDSGDRVSVVLKIDPKHAPKIRERSTALIAGNNFPNVSGQMVVEVVNSPIDSPPLPAGSVLKGQEGRLDLIAFLGAEEARKAGGAAREKAREALEGARDVAGRVAERTREVAGGVAERTREMAGGVRDLGPDEESISMLGKVRDFMGETASRGGAALDTVIEKWAILRGEMKVLIDKLVAAGKTVMADQFGRLMGEVDQMLERRKAAKSLETPQADPPAIDLPATPPPLVPFMP
jgi:hypothetical protein